MLKVVLSGLDLFLGRLGEGKTPHLGLDWNHFSLSVCVMKVVLSLLESRVKPNSVWVHSEVFLVIQEAETSGILGPSYQINARPFILETSFPPLKAPFALCGVKVIMKVIKACFGPFCVFELAFFCRRLFALRQSLQLIEMNSSQDSSDRIATFWVFKEGLRYFRNFSLGWFQDSTTKIYSVCFLPKPDCLC